MVSEGAKQNTACWETICLKHKSLSAHGCLDYQTVCVSHFEVLGKTKKQQQQTLSNYSGRPSTLINASEHFLKLHTESTGSQPTAVAVHLHSFRAVKPILDL